MASPYFDKLTVASMGVITSPSGSSTLATLSVTINPALRKIIVSASATGVYMAIGGAATSGSYPVPTTPLVLDMLPVEAATLQFLGDGAKTINLVQVACAAN